MKFDIYDGADYWGRKEFDSEADCLFWCNEKNLQYVVVN